MRRQSKSLALFLSSVMFLSAAIPTNAAIMAAEGKTLPAKEVESASRLDENRTKPNKLLTESKYDDDAMVVAIVEMQEAPVLDYYDISAYSGTSDTAGEAVSEFLASEDAQQLSGDLLDGQKEVLNEIAAFMPGTVSLEGNSANIEVCAQWTGLVNAMAIRIPYGMLDSIRQLEGVKRAYVQHVYDRPEEKGEAIDLTQDRYTYSLNMVGVQNAWEQGYTGKGMLVAVLDTGIDVLQNKQTGVAYGSHEVFTDNSFMSGNPKDGTDDWTVRYDADTISDFVNHNRLWANTNMNEDDDSIIVYENNILYKNLKVPYGFDYADWDVYTRPKESDHGIHVSGTIAGYAESSEGEVLFSGVAPDAQILAMKVFPDENGGADELSIYCALEDSLALGADIINLSLGSDNGFAEDSTMQHEAFARVEKAGIVMMTSAGNSANSTSGNNYEGSSLSGNTDISMMSSPAVYASNLAVASIDNNIDVQDYLHYTIDGETKDIAFADANGTMAGSFADKEYPIYVVDGVGTDRDFYAAGFNNGYNNGKTGIALVKRGEISFSDKLANASYYHGVSYGGEAYGVLACIIYDSDENSDALINMNVSGSTVTSCFISGRAGKEIADAVAAGKTVTIRTSSEPRTIEMATAGQMSEFSSWGAGPSLELKPEITAPGGNIWSSVKGADGENYTGTYEMMSGTSMAAPHMSGIAALVRQRVWKEFAGVLKEDMADVISELLVSTAAPVKEPNGTYYSPRLQGAGLVNADAAISTPVYISVDGYNCGKLELGDDVAKTGTYPINFNLTNVSKSDVTYDVSVVLMRPDTYEQETVWGNRTMMSTSDVEIATVSLGSVTAAAGKTVEFSNTVSLTSDQKAEIDMLFENGTYIEGYVFLKDTASVQPDLGLPMLAYYGDWTAAPIFDSANWFDTQDGENSLNNEVTWGSSRVGSVLYDYSGNAIGFYDLAQNVFLGENETQVVFHTENIAISPNGDGYFDSVDDFILYQLRDAMAVVIEVADADTDELYFHQVCTYMTKTKYDYQSGYSLPMSLYYNLAWDGTNLDGDALASGTKCVMTITAYGDGDYSAAGMVHDDYYDLDVINFDQIGPRDGFVQPTFNGHAMDMTGDQITFPVLVDTAAPKLENSAVSVTEEDGKTYISGKVYDEDGSLASVALVPIVKRTYKEGYGDPTYAEYGMDINNPFYLNNIYDAQTKELSFKADVTEYAHTNTSYEGENNYYNFTWEGNVILSCGDYGANDRSYAIKVDSTKGIVLSQTSALLHPGDKFELSVNDNTANDTAITRTSSDESVATIDEFGNVVAVAPGQAIITVSDGEYSATCIVAVEDVPTEVLDFKLSLDNMEGLKSNGQATVKVEDLYPANVNITEIKWEVSEDDEYAEAYAAGLISVEKASADALTGTLYLTVDSSILALPAGHAVLTVTINGVARTMDVSWDDISTERNQDDLKSGALYEEQVIYTTIGKPVNLSARYKENSLHEYGDVILTCENDGLVLDGPMFFNLGASYSAKLVNKEGFKLPDDIKIYTVYGPDSEYEMYPGYGYSPITYNKETGEIYIPYAPYGATNKLRIEANGVAAEGNPAGELSGATYNIPDGLYGPFDWSLEGAGEIESVMVSDWGVEHEEMQFTSSEAGVSYVTAASKDGRYSLKFAVVTEPIKADEIILDTHNVEMTCGDTNQINVSLKPEPKENLTSEDNAETKYSELVWKSFNESVATVDADGVITAVGAGTAYIKVSTKANTNVNNYLLVTVAEKDVEPPTEYTGLVEYDGTWYYLKDGVQDPTYTGLVEFYGTWYYVENGILNWDYTGLVSHNGGWYYVEGGVLYWNYTGFVEYYGTCYYVENSWLNWGYTGLAQYDGEWYYAEEGVLRYDYTGLTEYWGTWYYVENSCLSWDYYGLTEYWGTWYYVERSVLNWNYSGLTEYYGTWYYVENGILNWNYTGMTEYYGTWYYVEKGILNWNYTNAAYADARTGEIFKVSGGIGTK